MNSHNIKSKIRGPFAYLPSMNGVDNTFDVTCLRTNCIVAYSSYWEARDDAEAVAYAMAYALNRQFMPLRLRLKPTDHKLLNRFRKIYPGPYSVLIVSHGNDKHEIGVTDGQHEYLILAEDSANSDSESIAHHHWLAELLNSAFGYDGRSEQVAVHCTEAGYDAR